MKLGPTLSIFACLALISAANATVLILDDFGVPSDPNQNLNGRTPVTGPANWVGYSGGIDQGWKVYSGVALMGTAANSQNGMAGITMGANYFANNPGIYSLSATFEMVDNGDTGWYAIGFAQSFPTAGSRGFYESGTNEGEPWLFVREDGEVNVRPDGSTSIYDVGGYDITDIDVELQLDTTQADWTVAAFVNGAQLDLDAGAGMVYTYSTNPTDIAAAGLGATGTADGVIPVFQLQSIPEPQTYALLTGLGVLALAVYRRRR